MEKNMIICKANLKKSDSFKISPNKIEKAKGIKSASFNTPRDKMVTVSPDIIKTDQISKLKATLFESNFLIF